MDNPIKMYSFKETQEMLATEGKPMSRTMLRNLVINQEIQYTLLGHRKIYFTEEGIRQYIDSRTVRVKPYKQSATPNTDDK